ncbi:MAG: 50S ribosomal protein L19e [Candidatus Altiarchaeota archaeon]|nr:50S ribosomal protein L19e [Candidatus Altiarchaeota archaeon]
MNLVGQKRIASEILDVGVNRVKIDPEMQEDVSKAITRDDIRHHIATGAITAKPKRGISTGRVRKRTAQKKKGRRTGHGRRSGTKNARRPSKETWMSKIRALRDELKKMKENKDITATEYRKLYGQVKGNLFHSRRHLREHIERLKQ